MNLGLVTDCLKDLTLPQAADVCRELGISQVELGCGNWSPAPHIDLPALLQSRDRRDELVGTLAERGLTISALNCSGNPLFPGEKGERDRAVVEGTFALSEALGLHTVVMMSGLPAGAPGDCCPNWIVTSWPPETQEILRWQWAQAVPFWKELVKKANGRGVTRLALEPHAWQLVYSAETFFRLRGETDETVGFNLDPSHLFWMGADPIAVAEALAGCVYHVHVKDVRREAAADRNTMMDGKDVLEYASRSWNFRIPGSGHDGAWWRRLAQTLRRTGYDGVLSIEQEDYTLPTDAALRKTAALLHEHLSDLLQPV
jgi:sugar phosphate isomerase/epimerase